jgi:aminopeptidase N
VQYAAAVAAQPVASVKEATWAALTGSDALSNERVGALIRGFTAGPSRTLIERFDEQYYALLETFWRERSIEIARRLVIGLFPSAAHSEDADRWLSGHPDVPAALRRCVIEQRDHLARALAARSLSAQA